MVLAASRMLFNWDQHPPNAAGLGAGSLSLSCSVTCQHRCQGTWAAASLDPRSDPLQGLSGQGVPIGPEGVR